MQQELAPGRWDVQVFRGTDLQLPFFATVESLSSYIDKDQKRWIVIKFVEGGVFEGLCPRGVWMEPERH